jgi:hypothetical protein
VVVRGRKTRSRASGLSFVQKFIGLTSPHVGYMAQSEIGQMTFRVSSSVENYIDISSALTAANRKQHHQVTGRGVPLVYDCFVEHVTGASAGDSVTYLTAPNNWTVRNAVVKMSAAWKHQLKSAGIRMRDLSKYGRRIRIPLDKGMSAHGTGSMTDTLPPSGYQVSDGAIIELFETYTTPAGDVVSYNGANEFTRVAIPDEAGGGDSVEMNLSLLGYSEAIAGNAYFGVVDEYLGSRGGITDKPDSSSQTPDALNFLQSMFSSTQPSTDEVIEAIEDYQEYRPYADGNLDASATPVTVSSLCDTAHDAGTTAASYSPDTSGGAAFTGPSSSINLLAPLGLIRILGTANKDVFKVTVRAIYEM